MRGEARPGRDGRGAVPASCAESGLSLVEFVIASVIALMVMLAVYSFIDGAKQSYVEVSDDSAAQSQGRALIEVLSDDARLAGYSPLGVAFDAIPAGTATRVRFLSDLDEDGTVGVSGEAGENITWDFSDPDGDGVFQVVRGTDLNGDGDFDDSDESSEVISQDIVQIDADGNGSLDDFLSYDVTPPDTTRLGIRFGVRTAHRDRDTHDFRVVDFRADAVLRNRL